MPTPPLADLIEYDGSVPYRQLKRVSTASLRKQHSKRWVMHTSLGDVVLKKLGQLDMDRISIEIVTEHPEYLEIIQRISTIQDFEKFGAPLDAKHIEELTTLGRKLIPFQKQFSRGCFVEYRCANCRGSGKIRVPQNIVSYSPVPDGTMVDCPDCRGTGNGGKEFPMFEDIEDYDAFLSALKPGEVDQLYKVLEELTSPKPAGEISDLSIFLAKEFHIPLSDDLTMENMTAEQAGALVQVMERQAEQLKHEAEKHRDA